MRVLQIYFLAVGVYLHKISSELLTMTLRLGDIAQALCVADTFLCRGSILSENIIRIVDHDSQTMIYFTESLCCSL